MARYDIEITDPSLKRFKIGDWVMDPFTSNSEIIGIVVDINDDTNTLDVDWNNAQPFPTRHQPQELMVSPWQTFVGRKGSQNKTQLTAGDKGIFSSEHPIEDVRGQEFKVVKASGSKVLMELVGSAKMVWGGPEYFSSKKVNDNYDLVKLNKRTSRLKRIAQKIKEKQLEKIVKAVRLEKIKIALYHAELGRVYKKTLKELDDDILLCPKCKSEMKKRKYKKGNPLYQCTNDDCGFMISSRSIL